MLGQHIVADPIYEGAQFLWARESPPISQSMKDAEECLLANILNGLRATHAPLEFDQE